MNSQSSNRNLVLLIVASIIGIVMYLQFGSKDSPSEEKEQVPTVVKDSAEQVIAKDKSTVQGSTVADKAKPASPTPTIAPEDQVPSEAKDTADPNDEPDNALAGIRYQDIQMWELERYKLPEKVKGGVLISKIHAKSSFAESQVRPGDIVTHAHHSKVVNFTDLENAVQGRTHTLLDVYRDGKPYQVVLNKPFRSSGK